MGVIKEFFSNNWFPPSLLFLMVHLWWAYAPRFSSLAFIDALIKMHLLTKHHLVSLAFTQELHIVRAGANCSAGPSERDLIIDWILTELPNLAKNDRLLAFSHIPSLTPHLWQPTFSFCSNLYDGIMERGWWNKKATFVRLNHYYFERQKCIP